MLSLLLGLVFGQVVDYQFLPKTSLEASRWKPSFVWWLIGLCFFALSCISTKLLSVILLAWRLDWSATSWRTIGCYTMLFFLIIGIINPILYQYSEELWFSFKILAVPSGLLMISLIIPVIIHRKEAKQTKSQY